MLHCSRCGFDINLPSSFCGNCGQPVARIQDQLSTGPAARRTGSALMIGLIVVAILIVGATVGVIVWKRSSTGSVAAQSIAQTAAFAGTPNATLSSTPTGGAAPAMAPPRSSASIKTVTVTPSAPKAIRTDPPSNASTVTKTSIVTATSSPENLAAIYKKVQSGVVRIETVGCTDSGVGTGFLLSPTLVATVEHVVHESEVISLIDGDQRTTGTVIGLDPARDLALVRADRPISGYHFDWSTAAPSVGDSVAAIGFPIGGPITLTHGAISGLDRKITVEGTPRAGMIETDTPINPGNSGGPLLASDGSVVGLVDALETDANGIAYAVPAAQAAPADRTWTRSPQDQPAANCDDPLGPTQQQADIPSEPSSGVTSGQLNGIISTFEFYFNGINSGNYAQAFEALTPEEQAGGEGIFADGVSTSYDSNFQLFGSQVVDSRTINVGLAFNSIQRSDKGPDGDTCDNWTLVFTMSQQDNGIWLIGPAKPYNGSTHVSC